MTTQLVEVHSNLQKLQFATKIVDVSDGMVVAAIHAVVKRFARRGQHAASGTQ